jgi:hypothetical protein
MLRYVALPLLIGLVGCGDAHSKHAGDRVRQGLEVAPGSFVTLATYTITGPNGFASAGNVPVGESPDVSVTLSHLPVGQGYVLSLSATASDGVIECQGSTAFDVIDANTTFAVTVHLTCAVPSGDVDVDTSLNLCPVLDGLSASPLNLRLGGVSSLVVAAHDPDDGPSPLAYSWRVNGVRLPAQTAPSLGFTCSSPGQVTISAGVSDGHRDPACAASATATVSCE